MLRFILFLPTLLASTLSLAQTPNLSLKLDTTKPLRLEYQSVAWNKNQEKIENHSLMMRDAGSGKLVRIELQETGPNTNLFEGSYQISFTPNADVLPEIYLPSEDILKAEDQYKRVESLIKEGLLLRKPIFLRQESKTLQVISVFDTREQAYEAYEAYKRTRPALSRAALEAQQQAPLSLDKDKAKAQLEKFQKERLSLEEEERLRLEALKAKQAALDAEQKAQQKAEAARLAQQAMAAYKQENYKEAEALFARSADLDPENTGYYYQFGVTLYKNDKFNRSLVALGLAAGPDVDPVEKDYYIALNHMKQKEYGLAFKGFKRVQAANQKNLSASAAFFAGVLDFQKENYDRAKTEFEFVLDKSDDPKMDKQAENYIEQIANIKAFQANKAKKFIYTLSLGISYDSNIINQASSSGSATDQAGYRIPFGGSLEYRPIYTESSEFSTILSLSNITSFSTKFAPSQTLQQYDPLSLNLSLPYKFKGRAFEKPYQMTISPAYEITYMNVDTTKSGLIDNREPIVNSMILHNDNTFVMTDDWFATYSLELRSDNSLINGAADEDNQSAIKYTLSTNQVFFQDKKKTTAFGAEGGVSLNQAKGINQRFQRLDLAGSYVTPWISDINISTRLALYDAMYTQALVSRTDLNLGLSFGLQKSLNQAFAATASFTYNNNMSNVDSSKYNKFVIMTGVVYSGAF